MPTLSELRNGLKAGEYDAALSELYKDLTAAKRRIQRLIELFSDDFGDGGAEVSLFSSPGRTEIGGNHTDHNNGRVLAGAIGLDTLGLACLNDEPAIRLHSVGFSKNTVNIETLSPDEGGSTSDRLIRGVCAGFARAMLPYGGFNAVTQSDVPSGSGLSSSAAFENLVGTILGHLYGQGGMDAAALAGIGNFAENIFIQKPSGLMDQTASAVGGLSLMDFENPEKPRVETIPFDLPGHTMIITGPIGSHADLTPEYAAIPQEMRKVAWALGSDTMRGVSPERFTAALPSLMTSLPGRALLRAYHFLCENERALQQADALKTGKFEEFLRLVNDSGRSSYMYLQNVVTQEEQGLGVALALSESLLFGRGAQRVHGGGFAGTIQAYVPDDLADAYKSGMEAVFGVGSCLVICIRKQGVVKVI
ncbi:MAG: galactokinase [Oscillospiraceae bacterium]|jgi:galactokinase|nr:galactokinase [Oscillospiraceae bacterium]